MNLTANPPQIGPITIGLSGCLFIWTGKHKDEMQIAWVTARCYDGYAQREILSMLSVSAGSLEVQAEFFATLPRSLSADGGGSEPQPTKQTTSNFTLIAFCGQGFRAPGVRSSVARGVQLNTPILGVRNPNPQDWRRFIGFEI